MINREQAAYLAKLARTIRPGWDELALINRIGTHQNQPLPDISAAVIKAADNPRAETPTAVDWAEHWPATPSQTAGDHRPRCPNPDHSGLAGHCPQCRSEQIAPAHPEACTQPGHLYWAHNCLDCRRDREASTHNDG